MTETYFPRKITVSGLFSALHFFMFTSVSEVMCKNGNGCCPGCLVPTCSTPSKMTLDYDYDYSFLIKLLKEASSVWILLQYHKKVLSVTSDLWQLVYNQVSCLSALSLRNWCEGEYEGPLSPLTLSSSWIQKAEWSWGYSLMRSSYLHHSVNIFSCFEMRV